MGEDMGTLMENFDKIDPNDNQTLSSELEALSNLSELLDDGTKQKMKSQIETRYSSLITNLKNQNLNDFMQSLNNKSNIDKIGIIQLYLKIIGYYNGRVDCNNGSGIKVAIEKFKQRN